MLFLQRAAPGLALCASVIGCTPFVGRAMNPPGDAASPEVDAGCSSVDGGCAGLCRPGALELGTPRRIATGLAVPPVVPQIDVAWSGDSALVVALDSAISGVRARRIGRDGRALRSDESIDVSEGTTLARTLRVVARSGGWLVGWGEGLAWVEANGEVSRRVSWSRATGQLFGNGALLALYADGNAAVLIYQQCETGCTVWGRRVLEDGTFSVGEVYYHSESTDFATIAAVRDAQGGLVAYVTGESPTTSAVHMISLDADGHVPSEPPVTRSLPGGYSVNAITTTRAGERALLLHGGLEDRILVLRANGTTTLSSAIEPTAPMVRAEALSATPTGFVLAQIGSASMAGVGAAPTVHSRFLDDSGERVPGSDQTLSQSSNPVAYASIATTRSPESAMVAWVLSDPASTPVVAAGPLSEREAHIQRAWELDATWGHIRDFDLQRGLAGTFVRVGLTVTRLDNDGAAMGSAFTLPEPPWGTVVTDREYWSVSSDAEYGLHLQRFDTDGRPQGAVVPFRDPSLQAFPGSPRRMAATWGYNGAVLAFAGRVVHTDLLGRLEGSATTIATTTPVRLIPARDGAILWVEWAAEGVRARRLGSMGQWEDRSLFQLDGFNGYPDAFDGWSCGSSCWGVLTNTGLWRIDSKGARLRAIYTPPRYNTAVATASSACGALLLGIDPDGALRFTLVAYDLTIAGPSAPSPLRPDDGMRVVGLGDGRFLAAVSGVDPTDPQHPGLFVIPVRNR